MRSPTCHYIACKSPAHAPSSFQRYFLSPSPSLRIIRNQWQQHSCGHHAIWTSTSQYPTLEIARTTASIRRRIVHHSSASCAGRSTQTVSIVECTSIDTSSEVRAFRIRRGWRRTSSVTIEVRDILSDEVKTVVDSEHLAWVRRGSHSG